MCRCTSEACKYKKRNRNGGHNDFLLSCNIGCKMHTAFRALIASRLSQGLQQDNFTSKWWLWSKAEAWNFTKNDLLNLSIQWNQTFVCRLKSEHNCSGKNFRQMHVLWIKLFENQRQYFLRRFERPKRSLKFLQWSLKTYFYPNTKLSIFYATVCCTRNRAV